MKIIIVNYRYFVSGGPERYLFNIKQVLESHGHEVVPFSVKSSLNQPTEYEDYFMSPIGSGKEVYYNEYNKKSPKTFFKVLIRMFYSREAKKKLSALIRKVQPDLVYVLHYQNKISPAIFDAARKHNIPVVYRASDFGQICANALFYRYNKKDTCERCLSGSRWNAVINKCVFNSYLLSAVKASALGLQDLLKVKNKIDAYVIPSGFTLSKFQQFGVPAEKLNCIPTFFNFANTDNSLAITYEPFAVYVGRLEEEKGLLTLVKAFVNTGQRLVIIGSASGGYDKVLVDFLKDKEHRIEFTGQLNFDAIQQHLRTCAFTIMPAEWYENFPNSVLESYAFRKPVVASDSGSLKEIVDDQYTGLLFPAKNAEALRVCITGLLADPARCRQLGENAYHKLTTAYSAEAHYRKLEEVFNRVLTTRKRTKESVQ